MSRPPGQPPAAAAAGSDSRIRAQRPGFGLGAEPNPRHGPSGIPMTTTATAPDELGGGGGAAVKVERRSSSFSPAPDHVAPFRPNTTPSTPLDDAGYGLGPALPKREKQKLPPGKPGVGKSERAEGEEEDEEDEDAMGDVGYEGEQAGEKASPASSSGKQAKSGKSSSTRHLHHPDIWEAHKDEIQDIYLKQNKPLKEVIAIMKDKGFKATTRMYKSKFEQWGFAKNNRKKDVAMMLRLQQQRDASGKNTTFSRHGRSIDIANYMRRKRITKAELVKLSGAEDEGSLPEYLRALTPPPAEVVEHMPLTGSLHTQDILLTCFRDLTRTWQDSATSTLSFMYDYNVYMDGEVCEASRDFSRACWFFSRGYTVHGALLSQRAFDAMHLVISQPSAMGLFDLLIASVLVPDANLARELWKYLAAYAEMRLGPSSNLCRLFRALDDEFRTKPMEACVDFVYNCLESIIGMLLATPLLAETVAPTMSLFLIADFVLFASKRRNLPSLQRASVSARQFAAAGSPNSGAEAAPVILSLLEPATLLWLRGPEDEQSFQFAFGSLQNINMLPPPFAWVQWLLWQVVAGHHRSRVLPESRAVSPAAASSTTTTMTTSPPDSSTSPSSSSSTSTSSPHSSSASVAASDPRHALARWSLERAVDAAEGNKGFGEFQIFENLQLLEDWHREAGDGAQEASVRRRKERALAAYLETLRRRAGGEGEGESSSTSPAPGGTSNNSKSKSKSNTTPRTPTSQ